MHLHNWTTCCCFQVTRSAHKRTNARPSGYSRDLVRTNFSKSSQPSNSSKLNRHVMALSCESCPCLIGLAMPHSGARCSLKPQPSTPNSHSTVTHLSTAEDKGWIQLAIDAGCRWLQARSGDGPETFVSNPAWCVFAVQRLSEELSLASQAHASKIQNSQGRPVVQVFISIGGK